MWSKVKAWLCAVWYRYNPYDIDKYVHEMSSTFQDFRDALEEIRNANNVTIALLENELAEKEFVLQQFVDVIPDMVWLKQYDELGNGGNYLYANKAIREQLLLDDNPRGKTDVAMALAAKVRFGDENHTFGEKCANSDLITLANWKLGKGSSRFLESGKVKGEMVYLEVNKTVVEAGDGRVLGVCGTGRILTEYVEAVNKFVEEEDCHNACSIAVKELREVFKRYEFGSEG